MASQGPLGVNGMRCCGWREIFNLSSYQGDFNLALKSLCNSGVIGINYTGCGALLFTAAGSRSSYASKFAKDIVENKLGEVIKLPVFKNPNTGRQIKGYMWILDKTALTVYLRKHNLAREPF
jgi:hypothetical protein